MVDLIEEKGFKCAVVMWFREEDLCRRKFDVVVFESEPRSASLAFVGEKGQQRAESGCKRASADMNCDRPGLMRFFCISPSNFGHIVDTYYKEVHSRLFLNGIEESKVSFSILVRLKGFGCFCASDETT